MTTYYILCIKLKSETAAKTTKRFVVHLDLLDCDFENQIFSIVEKNKHYY